MTKAALAVVALLVAASAVAALAGLTVNQGEDLINDAGMQMANGYLLSMSFTKAQASSAAATSAINTLLDPEHQQQCTDATATKTQAAQEASDAGLELAQAWAVKLTAAIEVSSAQTQVTTYDGDLQPATTSVADTFGEASALRSTFVTEYRSALELTICTTKSDCAGSMSSSIAWGACNDRACYLDCINQHCTLIDDTVEAPVPSPDDTDDRTRDLANRVLRRTARRASSRRLGADLAKQRIAFCKVMFDVLKVVFTGSKDGLAALNKVHDDLPAAVTRAQDALSNAAQAVQDAAAKKLLKDQAYENAANGMATKCGVVDAAGDLSTAAGPSLASVSQLATAGIADVQQKIMPGPLSIAKFVWEQVDCSEDPLFCVNNLETFRLAATLDPTFGCDLETLAPVCIQNRCACHAPAAAQRGRWALRF